MVTEITSPQNQRIKTLVKLSKRRVRDAERHTVVEGVREVTRALAAGIRPLEAYICPELATDPALLEDLALLYRMEEAGRMPLFHVTAAVFGKIAYRAESGGILLVIPYVDRPLEQLPLGDAPFVAVVEGVEKPGNLGAILRTADAAGVDAVVICSGPDQGGTDLHNPNVVRASLGAIFTRPVAQCSTAEVIHWLRAKGIRLLVAGPDATGLIYEQNLRGPVAVAFGSEAHGATAALLAGSHAVVRIPMQGTVDSLNLSTAAAVVLYEVVRQRLTGVGDR